ncbi:MAG: SHOCT domain-containing protein [Syntrophomonadaceae bacterium]|nr:SHOCT domain-containing protein [Syntrophomonadaceae bacterium]
MGWLWIILIGLAVYLIYLNNNSRTTGSGSSSLKETPLEIAQKRYARGEITKEQFEELKRDLQ